MTGKQNKSLYAAVMGDLVRSERVGSIEHLHDRFNAAIERQNHAYREALASPLTITLGDEFQGLTPSLVAAANIARDLRFDLIADGIECRFAIGTVELRTPLNAKKAWNMMGPGLARTREKLSEKRTTSLYRFAVSDPIIETTLEALGAGLTTIERGWTDQQRQDIIGSLAGTSATEIAKQRNVSVHSVYKVRISGNFDAYVVQWHAVLQALAYLDGLRDV